MTCEEEIWSVVQVMVAEVAVIPVAVMSESPGAAPPELVTKVKLADAPAGTDALFDSAT